MIIEEAFKFQYCFAVLKYVVTVAKIYNNELYGHL